MFRLAASSIGVMTPSSTSDMVRMMPPSTIGSSNPSSRALASSSIEYESVRARLRDWASLGVSAKLGRRDVEGRRLGPLNMNAAGDTKSMLGTDPCNEELGLEPKLEARDLDA